MSSSSRIRSEDSESMYHGAVIRSPPPGDGTGNDSGGPIARANSENQRGLNSRTTLFGPLGVNNVRAYTMAVATKLGEATACSRSHNGSLLMVGTSAPDVAAVSGGGEIRRDNESRSCGQFLTNLRPLTVRDRAAYTQGGLYKAEEHEPGAIGVDIVGDAP
jgi:hypothetical protein